MLKPALLIPKSRSLWRERDLALVLSVTSLTEGNLKLCIYVSRLAGIRQYLTSQVVVQKSGKEKSERAKTGKTFWILYSFPEGFFIHCSIQMVSGKLMMEPTLSDVNMKTDREALLRWLNWSVQRQRGLAAVP